MASPVPERRLTFQEALELVPLAPAASGNRRFVSTRAAWLPGIDLPVLREIAGPGKFVANHRAAFGGHTYSQSVLAVCKVLEEVQGDAASSLSPSLGLHSIHGYWTAMGHTDRPFVYEVAILTRGRTFVTARADVRQPQQPSTTTDHFLPAEADQQPLGPICFTAIASFVQPQPHSMGANRQEPPAQMRFVDVLRTRPPSWWLPSPPVDIEVLFKLFDCRDVVGTFPMVDMKKVDMAAYNADRPLDERRELILYRLLAPLPGDTPAAANRHVLVHAYAADRNGLLMAANHLAFPMNKKTASLSNSFVVHCNVEAAVMAHRDGEGAGDDLDDWWLQEVCFPRAGAGRAIIHSKIWSPAGVHVATEYQDGLCVGQDLPSFHAKM